MATFTTLTKVYSTEYFWQLGGMKYLTNENASSAVQLVYMYYGHSN